MEVFREVVEIKKPVNIEVYRLLAPPKILISNQLRQDLAKLFELKPVFEDFLGGRASAREFDYSR
jgi:hypothetical protein